MTAADATLHRDVDEIFPGLVADRRYLHQHPELGFQEFATAQFVAERLRALGVADVRTGVAGTGVTGLIHGEGPGNGKVLLLRADMDALPIQEENDVDYRSQAPGKMHACGHDAHVAMLLGTARMLMDRRHLFAGTVKLVFQPAEEGGGGAKAMIDAGVLENPKVDAAFGLHIWQGADLGTVWARPGTAMVGADGFTITIQGKGGHGARPQSTVDPIAVGAYLVSAVQSLVSRERDPTMPEVVSICRFNAGDAANVIPDVAELGGTTRTVAQWQREEVKARLAAVAEQVAAALRASVNLRFTFGAPPLVNNAELTRIVQQAAAEVVGPENVADGPLMVVSEDFSEFLSRVPGCFFFVGSRNQERGLVWGHHHPRFDVDEAALAIGVETMTRAALHYLTGT